MKHIIFKFVAFTSIISLCMMTACVDDETTRLPQQLETWRARSITSTSAELSGFVVAEGEGLAETGIVYSTSADATVDDNKVTPDSTSNAVYWATLNDLDHLTTYYFRAYAMDNAGATIYGEETSFSTLANIATVNIGTVSDITDMTALVSAEIPYDGKSDVTERGFCINTVTEPTTDNNKVTSGDGTGEFYGQLEGLFGNLTYYVRAYATNSIGTAYSDELSFTTPAGVPTLTVTEPTSIEKTSATVLSNFIYSGGVDVTENGICYSTVSGPTVDDSKMVAADNELSTKEFVIAELEMNTTYYVRSYAINSVGVGYSDEISFTTLANITTWYIPGGYVSEAYPNSGYEDWKPEKSPTIMNSLETPDNLEGYIYIATDGGQWKFATQPNWEDTNYTAVGNELSIEGDNISSDAGYYKINVDMTTDPMTYTAMSTTWSITGDATADGWGSDVDLTYNPERQTWEGGLHMTKGEMKFRANNDWALAYGVRDGKLSDSGDNIQVETEGDYAVSLDFSTPRDYTYTANRWGLIGDATPGGWDSDTDLTWDAENSVFTVTIDLIVGKYKFRANDDWPINLGGDINALTYGGDDISVTEAGNYTITFNPFSKVATITKN